LNNRVHGRHDKGDFAAMAEGIRQSVIPFR